MHKYITISYVVLHVGKVLSKFDEYMKNQVFIRYLMIVCILSYELIEI